MINLFNVDFKYPVSHQRVFENFSLSLEGGKVYGLLGKNGTGKSTLLYLLSGLLQANRGEVIALGYNAKERNPAMLRDIFIVPEEFELPRTSLSNYVRALIPFYPSFSMDVLERCLSAFELSLDQKLYSLSMGNKKKVYMSVALAAGTKLILMDEPTNGLDIPSKSIFRKVVAENLNNDRTLIISTHQVHDVEQLLEHVVIIERNGILCNASVADISAKYSFGIRSPQEMDDSVLFAEPSIQGNMCLSLRKPNDPETPINLELFVAAAYNNKI